MAHNRQNIKRLICLIELFLIFNKIVNHFRTIRAINLKPKPKEAQIIKVDPIKFSDHFKIRSEQYFLSNQREKYDLHQIYEQCQSKTSNNRIFKKKTNSSIH